MNYTSKGKRFPQRLAFTLLSLAFSIFPCNFNCLAIEDEGAKLEAAGITTRLGNSIDMNLSLVDSAGESKTLSTLLAEGKPIVLIPVYYKCPRLCGLTLGGVVELVKDLNLSLGKDYRIVTFSFNPVENFELAAQKRGHYTTVLAEAGKSIEGWDFFVGEKSQTQALVDQLGFKIMSEGEEFAHSAAIFILDKSGRISQFFTDVDFPTPDVRLALVEASQGKIGSLLDQALLFCYKFDPDKGKYTWAVGRILQVVGALSILFIGGIIARLSFLEKKRLT